MIALKDVGTIMFLHQEGSNLWLLFLRLALNYNHESAVVLRPLCYRKE